MNHPARIYAFKEIRYEDELLTAFRLRYQVYRQKKHLHQLIKENKAQIEIDGYDVFARHYGLYQSGEIIGYIRVIDQDKPPMAETMLQKIAYQHCLLLPQRPHKFYFQQKFPGATDILEMNLPGFPYSICEPGRFIISPKHSTAGLARFVICNIMIVTCFLYHLPLGVIDCQKEHRAIYERYGFDWKAEEDQPKIAANPWSLLAISRTGVEKKIPDLPERILQYKTDDCFYY